MPGHGKNTFLLCAVLSFACSAVGAAALLPPLRHEWRSFQTSNFQFYFYRETEPLARALAPEAEKIHARLVQELKLAPSQRTHVLIYDNTDEANGMATVLPRSTIMLYATGEYAGGDGRVGGSLLEVFTHEYTHILQMGYIDDPEAALTGLIGQILQPNVYLPPWCIEGLAVAMESEFFPSGRLQSSTWRMYLRADFLAGRILSWPEVTNGPYRWPYGNAWYLYGSYFTRYLLERYGRDKVSAFYRETAAGLPYTTLDRAFDDTFGLSLNEAVTAWHVAAGTEFEAEANRIKAAGLMEGRPVASYGGRSGQGCFAPDGGLYFMQRSYVAPTRLMSASPPYDKAVVVTAMPAAEPAVSPDGRRVVYGLLSAHGENLYSDLYALDLRSGRTRRLGAGLRASDPSWSPEGAEVAFIKNSPPNYSLYRMSVNGGPALPIWEATDQEQAFSPAWSPKGDQIAFTRYRPDDGLRLWLVRPDGSGLTLVHEGAALGEEIEPAWSPDGRYLFFAADPQGVFDIFAFDTETESLWQVTNVLNGAYAPAISPDGKVLAYTGYSTSGYDEYVMDLNREDWRPYGDVVHERPSAPTGASAGSFYTAGAPPDTTPAVPYSPWQTLDPQLVYLMAGADTYGNHNVEIALAGMDVLQTVAYTLDLTGGSNSLGYRAELDLRLAPFTVGIQSSRIQVQDPLSSSLWQELFNAIQLEGGLGNFGWSLALYEQAYDFDESRPSQTYLGARLNLDYDCTRVYRGPVALVDGYRLGLELGAEEYLETGEIMVWQGITGRFYQPLADKSRLEIGLEFGHNSAGEAAADLGAPWLTSPKGYLVWDADTLLEFPFIQPEAGGTLIPGYLHAVNGVAAIHLGQSLDPAGPLAYSYGFGADFRLQVGFSLPLDLYLLLLWTADTLDPTLVFWYRMYI